MVDAARQQHIQECGLSASSSNPLSTGDDAAAALISDDGADSHLVELHVLCTTCRTPIVEPFDPVTLLPVELYHYASAGLTDVHGTRVVGEQAACAQRAFCTPTCFVNHWNTIMADHPLLMYVKERLINAAAGIPAAVCNPADGGGSMLVSGGGGGGGYSSCDAAAAAAAACASSVYTSDDMM
jgi:hypothetical protein